VDDELDEPVFEAFDVLPHQRYPFGLRVWRVDG